MYDGITTLGIFKNNLYETKYSNYLHKTYRFLMLVANLLASIYIAAYSSYMLWPHHKAPLILFNTSLAIFILIMCLGIKYKVCYWVSAIAYNAIAFSALIYTLHGSPLLIGILPILLLHMLLIGIFQLTIHNIQAILTSCGIIGVMISCIVSYRRQALNLLSKIGWCLLLLILLNCLHFLFTRISKSLYWTHKMLKQRAKKICEFLNKLPLGVIIFKGNKNCFKNEEACKLLNTNIEKEIIDIMQKEPNGEFTNNCKLIKKDLIKISLFDEQADAILISDVTFKKELDIEREQNKFKSMALATVTHELRAPTASALNILTMLKPIITSKVKKYYDNIKACLELVLSLIFDILDYSKIQDGSLLIVKEPIPIKDTINQVANILGFQAAQKNLIIEKKIDIPKIMGMGDKRRYKQIVLNLFSNAIKFTEKGTFTITVEAHDGLIWTIVEDTGLGISEGQMDKLFKPFSMLEEHKIMNPNGNGLGLSICKSLVNAMGGQIMAASILGKGSRFQFSVLLQENMEAPSIKSSEVLSIAASKKSASLSKFSPTSKRIRKSNILVVDDNHFNIFGLLIILDSLGVGYLSAFDGLKALDSVKEDNGTIKLILMDIEMPIMNGYASSLAIKNGSLNQINLTFL